MKRSDAFPSTYLSKEDITAPLVASIESVQKETIQSEHGEEERPVMRFREDGKPLILNGTNWDVCEATFGEESDKWRGRTVEIYVDPRVKFKGKTVGGIRLRLPEVERQRATVGDFVADRLTEEREGKGKF